jgi:cystathionine beta-lyase/cystathionine gamma-synthase
MTEEDRKAYGVSDSLVRISVGIEDWRDLLHDFHQSLDML